MDINELRTTLEALVEAYEDRASGHQAGRFLRRRGRALLAELDRLRALEALVLAAPVVTVNETGATFGHGDYGSYWTIGDSYSTPPEGIRNGVRVHLLPAGDGEGGDE